MYRKFTQIFFFLFLLKLAISKKGFVSENYGETKFVCPTKDMKVYSVKGEIQCTHRCLQHDQCELLNYNEGEIQDNCEIFTNASKCATKNGMKGWKAMKFQVIFDIFFLFNRLIEFVCLVKNLNQLYRCLML